MESTNTIDADRVTSLFINSIPKSYCPDCHEATCSCPKLKRKKNKSKIEAGLKLIREQKRQRALAGLQKAFKEEDAALCRFN